MLSSHNFKALIFTPSSLIQKHEIVKLDLLNNDKKDPKNGKSPAIFIMATIQL